MKAVVTGGAGFIGSRLAAALLRTGYETLVVDDLSFGAAADIPQGARFVQINVCDSEFPRLLASERPDIVYHLAAQADISRSSFDPVADLTTNVVGTLQALEGCRLSGAKMVLASTDAVFGDTNLFSLDEETSVRPVSSYGLSKWLAERYTIWYHRIHGVPFTILRLANVYGPGQRAEGEGRVVAVFVERLRTGKPLIVYGDGSQVRDFVYVDDVVSAFAMAAEGGANETIHIGTGQPRSIASVIGEIAALGTGGLPEVLYTNRRPVDASRSVFVPEKAAAQLGWSPLVGFAAGLSATCGAAFGTSAAPQSADSGITAEPDSVRGDECLDRL